MDKSSTYIIPQDLLDRLDGICIGLQDVLLDIFSNHEASDEIEDETGVDLRDVF